MPTLRNFHGGSVVPDLGQALGVLFKGVDEGRAIRSTQAKEQELQRLLGVITGAETPPIAGSDPGSAETFPLGEDPGFPAPKDPKQVEAALVRLAAINPQVANSVRSTLERGDKQELEAVRRETEKGVRLAATVQGIPDHAGRRQAIMRAGQEAVARGEDPSRFLALANMPEEQLDLELRRMMVQGADLKTLTDQALNPPETFEEVLDSQGNILGQRSSKTGKVVDDPRAIETEAQLRQSLAKKAAGRNITNVNVGGTRVQAFEKESGKLGAQADNSVRTEVKANARNAGRHKARVKNLQRTLDKASQGPLSQFIPALSRVIPGIDGTDEQAAAAQINDFVLDKMSAFKGSTSEKELEFAKETVQRLGNTREANQIITRSFLNAALIAEQEDRQLKEHVKNGGKPRDFVFDFDAVAVPGHKVHGDVTLSDIQETAIANGMTMEEVIDKLRSD